MHQSILRFRLIVKNLCSSLNKLYLIKLKKILTALFNELTKVNSQQENYTIDNKDLSLENTPNVLIGHDIVLDFIFNDIACKLKNSEINVHRFSVSKFGKTTRLDDLSLIEQGLLTSSDVVLMSSRTKLTKAICNVCQD